VLIDIDGARASFGLAMAGRIGAFSLVKEYRTADFPTATDCVMRFAKDAGIMLEAHDCAVAVSGAISGDAVRIARCPWIISMTGFRHLFQKPVRFLNDGAAMLWGATHVGASSHRSLGPHPLPDFSKEGKWLGINYGTGLGAALLVGSNGSRMQHIETEAGHVAFAPMGEVEQKLHHNLERLKKPVSWERALFADAGDDAWREMAVHNDLKALVSHRAEMLGSFVGDMILATGAWNGVLLFGGAASILSTPANLALFDKRIEARANYQLQLRKAPRWAVSMPNINLVGLDRFLQHHCEARKDMA
jgi:glucokinase